MALYGVTLTTNQITMNTDSVLDDLLPSVKDRVTAEKIRLVSSFNRISPNSCTYYRDVEFLIGEANANGFYDLAEKFYNRRKNHKK